ncbi:hypothetical protein KKC08_00615 [Patescibacteria group bacterium]|nr:hypothetical protein [Patescibacteria group bacterium]MCG2701577.1 hypothetical protein [Candidatus Parcubacteria bacterium]MBU4264455.1 hypothetical protein [Patescibacteria group bacterium]MBU4390386.1 hypothetical protein [Patescibacteria group bacterium]MBU4396657.1 hypothetical protein [Patescibacteria group bacterium]
MNFKKAKVINQAKLEKNIQKVVKVNSQCGDCGDCACAEGKIKASNKADCDCAC